MKITIADFKEWYQFEELTDWFTSAFPSGEAKWTEFVAACPKKEWVAWTAYRAGRDWPDDHYTPEIAKALIETKNAEYLYRAGDDWPDSRYTPAIAAALIATKNANYLDFAGNDWPGDRFRSAIADALKAAYPPPEKTL